MYWSLVLSRGEFIAIFDKKPPQVRARVLGGNEVRLDSVHNAAGHRALRRVRSPHVCLPEHDPDHSQTEQGEIVVKRNGPLGRNYSIGRKCALERNRALGRKLDLV